MGEGAKGQHGQEASKGPRGVHAVSLTAAMPGPSLPSTLTRDPLTKEVFRRGGRAHGPWSFHALQERPHALVASCEGWRPFPLIHTLPAVSTGNSGQPCNLAQVTFPADRVAPSCTATLSFPEPGQTATPVALPFRGPAKSEFPVNSGLGC